MNKDSNDSSDKDNLLNEGTFFTEGNLSDCGEEDELVRKINALFEEVDMYRTESEVEPDVDFDFVETSIQFENLGKLKKTLKEKCKNCGGLLQVRTYQESRVEDGEDYLQDVDYIECKNCDFTNEIEPKRKRAKDKGKNFKYDKEDDLNANGKNNVRKSTPSRTGKNSNEGYRKR
jgi:RNase P subunit RPR2